MLLMLLMLMLQVPIRQRRSITGEHRQPRCCQEFRVWGPKLSPVGLFKASAQPQRVRTLYGAEIFC